MYKNKPQPSFNQVYLRESTFKNSRVDLSLKHNQPASSQFMSQQTTGRGLEESVEYPSERTMSYDMEQNYRVMSRTSSDLLLSLQQSGPVSYYLHTPSAQRTCEANQPYFKTVEVVKQAKEKPQPAEAKEAPKEDCQLVTHRRRKSIIVLEESNQENMTQSMRRITVDKEPSEFFDMTMFQQKIWQRLMSLTQQQINAACQLEVLVNAPHEEYEMVIDIQNIPYLWDITQLADLINRVFQKQHGFIGNRCPFQCKAIKRPQLSMLVGRIKTQRIESSMRVFELINLVVNGVQLLVLEEQQKQ